MVQTAAQKKKLEAEKAENDRLESLYKARVLAGGEDAELAIADLEKETLERFALELANKQKVTEQMQAAQAQLEERGTSIKEAEEHLAKVHRDATVEIQQSRAHLEQQEGAIRQAAEQLAFTQQAVALANAELNQARRNAERQAEANAPVQGAQAPIAPHIPVAHIQVAQVPVAQMPVAQIPGAQPQNQQFEPTLTATFNVGETYSRLFNGKPGEDAKSHIHGYMDYVHNTLTAAPINHPMRLHELQIGRFKESLSGQAREWMVGKHFDSLQQLKTRFLDRFAKYHSTGDDLARMSTPMKPGTSVEAYADRLKISTDRLGVDEIVLGKTLLTNLPPELKGYAMSRGARLYDDIVRECKEMERNGPSRAHIAAQAASPAIEHDFNTSLNAISTTGIDNRADELLEGMKNILQYVSKQEDRGRQRLKSPAPGKGQFPQKSASKERIVQFQDQVNSKQNSQPQSNSQSNSQSGSRSNSKEGGNSQGGNSQERRPSQERKRSKSQEYRDSQAAGNFQQGGYQGNNFQRNFQQGGYQGNNFKGNFQQGNGYQGNNFQGNNTQQGNSGQGRGNPGYFGKGNGCFNCGETDHYWRNCEHPRRTTIKMESERNGLRAYLDFAGGGSGEPFHHSSK